MKNMSQKKIVIKKIQINYKNFDFNLIWFRTFDPPPLLLWTTSTCHQNTFEGLQLLLDITVRRMLSFWRVEAHCYCHSCCSSNWAWCGWPLCHAVKFSPLKASLWDSHCWQRLHRSQTNHPKPGGNSTRSEWNQIKHILKWSWMY